MKTVLISDFKAKCIGMLKEVQASGEPLTITLRGRPIARVEPISEKKKEIRLGALKGSMEIRGDIIRSDMEKDWLLDSRDCAVDRARFAPFSAIFSRLASRLAPGIACRHRGCHA